MYCGYMDKWVLPTIANQPGTAVDVVIVSSAGGIANPGAREPAFSGSDGQQTNLPSLADMESNLRKYIQAYGLTASTVHFYLAPVETQQAWRIGELPTIAIVNASNKVTAVKAGGLTVNQMQSLMQTAYNPKN